MKDKTKAPEWPETEYLKLVGATVVGVARDTKDKHRPYGLVLEFPDRSRDVAWIQDGPKVGMSGYLNIQPLTIRPHTDACRRCGSMVTSQGRCADITCPFGECMQDDPRGWDGHPHAQVMKERMKQ